MDGEGVATWPRLERLLDEKCVVLRALVEEFLMLVRIIHGKYWVVTTYGKTELSCPRRLSCLNPPNRYSHGEDKEQCCHNTTARLLTIAPF